jgi:hypothetical protein
VGIVSRPIRAIEAQHVSRPVPGNTRGHAIECARCGDLQPVITFACGDNAQRITFRLDCGHTRRLGFTDLVSSMLLD